MDKMTAAEAKRLSDIARREANDASIRGALQKIQEDKTIKPTQSVLQSLSGVSDDTLREREWPYEQLAKLKKQRKIEKETVKNIDRESVKTERAKLKDFNEKLIKEIAYWVHQTNQLEQEIEQRVSENIRYKQSQQFYEQKAKELEKSLNILKTYLHDFHDVDADTVLGSNIN